MTVQLLDRPSGTMVEAQAGSAPSHSVGMGASAGGLATLLAAPWAILA